MVPIKYIIAFVMAMAVAGCQVQTTQSSHPGGGSPGASWHFNLSEHSNCSSSTGNPTRCDVTLVNAAASSGEFDWTVTSNPPVAVVNPLSGAAARGASEQVVVTVPSGSPCPVTVTFADAVHNATITFSVTSVDGVSC